MAILGSAVHIKTIQLYILLRFIDCHSVLSSSERETMRTLWLGARNSECQARAKGKERCWLSNKQLTQKKKDSCCNHGHRSGCSTSDHISEARGHGHSRMARHPGYRSRPSAQAQPHDLAGQQRHRRATWSSRNATTLGGAQAASTGAQIALPFKELLWGGRKRRDSKRNNYR